jgi:uncharacterized membrane protein
VKKLFTRLVNKLISLLLSLSLSLSLSPLHLPTQVVLIPTWILLILFLISIIVYSCVRCCMFKLEENPQEVKIRRPLVTVLIVCLFVIAFSFLLFLVSSNPHTTVTRFCGLGMVTTITTCI